MLIKSVEMTNSAYTPQDGFPYYYSLVKSIDCISLFSSSATFTFLNSIDEEKASYRYAPNKWSIKQIIGHITDHERIKMFRAFSLSRNAQIQLWGYDENFFVDNSRFDELTKEQLVADYNYVRQASVSFLNTLSESQLNIKGFAGQDEITLEDFLKSIIGHEVHHLNIIKERYLDYDSPRNSSL
tara:strand:- start:49972 stop:50523 length:552 start_codon:yes stop_codon:yes gene_type:complete